MPNHYLMYQGISFDEEGRDTMQPMFEAKWDVAPIKVVAQADYDAVVAERDNLEAGRRSWCDTRHMFEARIAVLESLIRDIYAVKPPGDDEWCTQPWSDLCDRICELVPDVMTEDDHG
jgi:hypothetical protein